MRLLWKVLLKEADPWVNDPRGNPHPPKMVVFAAILKVAFCTTYEGMESKLKTMDALVSEITGCDRVVTHSVIHAGTCRVRMKYLRRIFRRTNRKMSKRRAALDSTGFSTRNSSIWYDIRIRKMGKRKDCLKLHVLVDVDTGETLAVRITPSKAHDSPRGRAMLRETWSLDVVTGDTSYCSRENCTMVASHGAAPYFKLRKDATAKPKSHPAWKAMVTSCRKDEEAWLGIYHIRSFVEAVFAAIKKRFGKVLLSIKKSVQRRELFLKVLCYNIKESLYSARAHELGISRWVDCK